MKYLTSNISIGKLIALLFMLFNSATALSNNKISVSHCVIGGEKEITCILKTLPSVAISAGDSLALLDAEGQKIETTKAKEVFDNFVVVDIFQQFISSKNKFVVLEK